MLHDPARHEPLCDDSRWDAARALAQIQAIVGPHRARACRPGALARPPAGSRGRGTAGAVAEPLPRQRGRAVGAVVAASGRALRGWPSIRSTTRAGCSVRGGQSPDDGQAAPSYLIGEVGIRLVLWRLDPQAEPLEPLFEAVRGNIANPTNEALWGRTGHDARRLHLWQATGEARWRDLWRENAAQVWRTWQADEATGCDLWTQDMYGRITQYLGAGHGLVRQPAPRC